MDLRQLEMLAAVVDAGSYSKAGERLHVSHSAIHRQVRLLEDEVGDRILVRAGRRVDLTATGEILLHLSRRLQQEVSAAVRQIQDLKQLHCGRLRIGTGTTMLVFFLPPVLDLFREQYPGVEVQVETGTAEHVLEGIRTGKLDVGVILASREIRSLEPSLACEVLYQEEFVVVVGKNHPLSKQKTVSLERLAEYPLITPPKTSRLRQVLDRICAKAGITVKISMELENEEAMELMVAIGMGIALFSRHRAVRDHLHYLRITGKRVFCDVGLVFKHGEYIQKSVREFGRLCRESCPEPSSPRRRS